VAENGVSSACPECGGRGWVVAPDGGNGTARPCACRERERVPRLFGAAEIPERYRRCRLSTFDRSHNNPRVKDQLLRAFRESERYVDEFMNAEGEFRESGLIFFGPPGTGKTHLAVAVLSELIERYGAHGRFVNFNELVQQIKATFDPNSEESTAEVFDPLTRAELLVFDELGAQKQTPWVNDLLYLILNQRYVKRLPTIFTTNFLLQPGRAEAPAPSVGPRSLDRGADAPSAPTVEVTKLLSSRLPAPLVSRIFEMAKPIDMTSATDFRREVLMHGKHA
jgi:DNA replication protein DnaC